MKYLYLLFFATACAGQSKETMRAEYDSIIKVIDWQKKMIDADSAVLEISSLSGTPEYYYSQKRHDSLKVDLKRLEARKKELAEIIF